ncbi:MAG TPA: hypothetical protein VH374_10030 [Polyangia bacterium]|nr:hypothetical protein [Polyangia bacterium]
MILIFSSARHQQNFPSRHIQMVSVSSRLVRGSFLLPLLVAGCSSSGGGGAKDGSCSSSAASATLAGPCDLADHVGQFSLALEAASGSTPAYSQLAGSVHDKVDPSTVWTAAMTSGGCSVLTGPTYTCATKCVSPQICVAQDTCGAAHTLQSAGDVTLTGVGCARTEAFMPASGYFDSLTGIAYPPVDPGTALSISAAGGAAAAFTLHGEGIEPLAVPTGMLSLVSGQDLTVTWTAPLAASMASIQIVIDAAHHGGTLARLECDTLPDTGTATIDGALVAALISKGVAGFPTITITRRAVDSTMIGAGCVDFSVSSSVTSAIMVCQAAGSCTVSCNCGGSSGSGACSGAASDVPCAPGMTCQADLTCK